MRMFNKIFIHALVLVNTFVAVPATKAAESNCTQNRVDGTTKPNRTWYISPTRAWFRPTLKGLSRFTNGKTTTGTVARCP